MFTLKDMYDLDHTMAKDYLQQLVLLLLKILQHLMYEIILF